MRFGDLSVSAGRTVAIIGAGVAGLSAASYLARQGCAVKVFEAASTIGGACADTNVGGYVFNQGAQYLLLPALLDHVFGRLGADRARALPLRRVTAPKTVLLDDGAAITLGEDLRVISSHDPIDASRAESDLQRMVEKWQPLLRVFLDEDVLRGPFSYRRLLAKSWRHLPKFARTLEAELNTLFSDPTFRTCMAGLLLFSGAHPRALPAPSIVALVSMLTDGMALPEGGMGRIPDALEQTVYQHGGEVSLNSRVKRIVLRNGRVQAIEVEGLGNIDTQSVISTISALTTYGMLLRADEQPGRLRKKVQRTPRSMKAFCIQLGLSNVISATSHVNFLIPSMEHLDHYFEPPSPGATWGYYSVPTLVMPELAPEGGSIVEFYPAIRRDEPVTAWEEARSRELAESAIRWLSERHELQIAESRIRSPRDFQEQLRLHEGAIYGVSPTVGALGLFSHRSPIPGLFLAGQTTYPGFGIPTAALSGIYSAEALLSARRG